MGFLLLEEKERAEFLFSLLFCGSFFLFRCRRFRFPLATGQATFSPVLYRLTLVLLPSSSSPSLSPSLRNQSSCPASTRSGPCPGPSPRRSATPATPRAGCRSSSSPAPPPAPAQNASSSSPSSQPRSPFLLDGVPALELAAQAAVDDMVQFDYFGHVRPSSEGSSDDTNGGSSAPGRATPAARVRRATPGASRVGALIASGWRSPLDVVTQMACSEKHRDVLLVGRSLKIKKWFFFCPLSLSLSLSACSNRNGKF